MTQSEIIKPRNEDEILSIVNWALDEDRKIAIQGNNSRAWLGFPERSKPDRIMQLDQVEGVVAYEPEELFVAVRPGTPLQLVQHLLRQQGQMLAFDPLDLGFFQGVDAVGGSIGGMVASGLAGSRRLKAGSVRDHVLGFRAISGRGELFKSGGRVVKNVTGYDLSKLMTGSFGSLAAMTEVVLKTLPRPHDEASLFFVVPNLAEAAALTRKAWRSPLDASCFGFFPASLGLVSHASAGWVVAVRMDGAENALEARTQRMVSYLGQDYQQRTDAAQSELFWQEYGHGRCFKDEQTVMRVTLKPSDAVQFDGRLPGQLTAIYDWAGGLAYVAGMMDVAMARQLRGLFHDLGASYLTIKAPKDVKELLDWRSHPHESVMQLEARIRNAFDPKNIFCSERYF